MPGYPFFDYPEVSYDGQEEDFDYSRMGFWRPCGPEHLKYFSAVAYYTAKKLYKEMDVPIGIVGCNWGGTDRKLLDGRGLFKKAWAGMDRGL